MSNPVNIRKNQFFASCPKGLEAVLVDELASLGIEQAEQTFGGVEFTCKVSTALKAILFSRIASRIYMQIFDFDIKKEKDIYFEAKKYKWNSLFNMDQTFKIQTILGHSPNRSKRSQFTNSMYLGLQLKDGIVDRYRLDTKVRPNVDPENADISFLMHVSPYDNPHSSKEKVIVSVDLCGTPLSNRGYRLEKFAAPLRENLAAGIVRLINPNGEAPIIDAMTGSGTFIIEAAMHLSKIPPSINRVQSYLVDERNFPWSFLKMNFYTRDKYLQTEFNKHVADVIEKKEASQNLLDSMPYIAAIDVDQRHLEAAWKCMGRAGVKGFIDSMQADATKFTPPAHLQNGIYFCNPPYGERMDSNEDLEDLYYKLGENLKANFKGFDAYIFTGNLPLLKKIQLRTSSKHILYNGNIECRLAHYELY